MVKCQSGDLQALAVVTAAVILTFVLGFSGSATASDTTYAYDPQGRLVGVVDNLITSGHNGASYTYDAGGNITQAAPLSASVTSIVSTTPCCSATSGAQVVIYGDGFSGTPSQNTVLFNSKTATVLSSTLSTITATVPGSAGTGHIQVTSPAGMATSSFNFTGN